MSNAADATADFFQAKLADAEIQFARLNTETLVASELQFAVGGTDGAQKELVAHFNVGSRTIALEDVSAIYYRRPVRPTFLNVSSPGLAGWMENEVRRAWGGMLAATPNIRWVNHPLAISAASYKPEQLVRAQRAGLAVPQTLITSNPASAESFCEAHEWKVIAKPIGHGEIAGNSRLDDRIVYTNRVPQASRAQLNRVIHCPTLFQREILKELDLRVTVIGARVVTVALYSQEQSLSTVDCRRDNMRGMRYSLVQLPAEVEDASVRLARSYGLLYAAIDLVLDRTGQHWFLELNPAGQWAWLEQLVGAPISASLIECLIAA